MWAALSDTLGIVVWQEDGHILKTLGRAGHRFESIDVAPDGTLLAAADRDGNITLWSLESGQELHKLSAHDESVSHVLFSADAKLLASAGSDGFLRVWQLPSGTLANEFAYADGTITAINVAVSGQHLACGMTDGSVHVSSLETGAETSTWIAHQSAVLDVAFSPDGNRLVTGGEDHMVRVWQWRTAEPQWVGVGHVGFAATVAFHPRGELVMSAGASEHPRHYKEADGAIRLWDATSGEQIQPGSHQDSHLISIATTSDARRIVGARGSRTLSVWDSESGELIGQLSGLNPGPKPLALSPDERLLAVVSGGSVLLHDFETLRFLKKHTPESQGRVLTMSFSPDSSQLVLGHASGKIHVYDTANGHLIRSWQAHDLDQREGGIQLNHSPDGRLLASSGRDGTLAVWDAVNFDLLYRRPGPADQAQALTFSPDGWLLASAGYNGRILVREVITGDVVRDIKSETGLNCLRFASDNRTLVAGEFYDRLLCWDVSTGSRYVEVIARSSCTITDVALSRDGTVLASAQDDGSALLWDLQKLLRKAPPLSTSALTEPQLTQLWTDLGSDDAELAFAAVWDLVAGREQAAPFVESVLSPTFERYRLRVPVNDTEDRRQLRGAQILEYAQRLEHPEQSQSP